MKFMVQFTNKTFTVVDAHYWEHHKLLLEFISILIINIYFVN